MMENTLDPSSSALMLIDMQNDVIERYAHDKGVVQRFAKMLKGARALKMPVFHVTLVRNPDLAEFVPAITDAALQSQQQTRPSPAAQVLTEGTLGAEIVQELKPLRGEYLIPRRRSNPFYGTPLEIFLRALRIDTVLVGGIATEGPVETSVKDGRDRGFNFVVLSDCCTSPNPEYHDYALQKIFPRVARVMTSQRALELLMQGR